MNEQIRKQLSMCKRAKVPDFDDSTTQISIPKNNDTNFKPVDIEVADYILKPYKGFTLHEEWNNGVAPTDKVMEVVIEEEWGRMVKVTGIGIHDGKSWSGWLPRASFRII